MTHNTINCSHCNHPAWMHVREYREGTSLTCNHNGWQCANYCTKTRDDIINDEVTRLTEELKKEKELLNYLDKEIQYESSIDNYGDQVLDYCYWTIRGRCNDIRTAIRDEIEHQKRKDKPTSQNDDLPF